MDSYKCVYMRGGTSKAIFFHEKDLPKDKSLWNDIFLRVMGSPDIKQIDGMGGAVSSTSKIAVISKSEEEGIDVNYTFFQVDILIPRVDTKSNCGNISSAVGPFAIDEGLVEIKEPITVVRVLNTNTNKIIEEHVRVENGKAKVKGDEKISGVPGTGSRIDMYFENPGGAVSGKLFPSGNKKDIYNIDGVGEITVTLIDCANPVVFVKAEDIGLTGTELTEIHSNSTAMQRIENIRGIAALKMGLVDKWEDAAKFSTSIPKVSIISNPQEYLNIDGELVSKDEMDICCRAISVGQLHRAYPITVSIATAAAARVDGTIVSELLDSKIKKEDLIIGHSSGVIKVNIVSEKDVILKGGVVRTARRIMDGNIYV